MGESPSVSFLVDAGLPSILSLQTHHWNHWSPVHIIFFFYFCLYFISHLWYESMQISSFWEHHSLCNIIYPQEQMFNLIISVMALFLFSPQVRSILFNRKFGLQNYHYIYLFTFNKTQFNSKQCAIRKILFKWNVIECLLWTLYP